MILIRNKKALLIYTMDKVITKRQIEAAIRAELAIIESDLRKKVMAKWNKNPSTIPDITLDLDSIKVD